MTQPQPQIIDQSPPQTDQRQPAALALAQAHPLARSSGLTLDVLQMITVLAPSWHKSHFFGLSSPDQAIVIMAKAADLGLSITAALDFFDVIENKPVLKPVGAMALILRSGLVFVEIDDTQDDRCIVTMRRRDGTQFSHTVAYTLAEATKSNLIKPDKPGQAWVRFTKDMLYNRAVGRCARRVCADILHGLYLTSDFGPESEEAAS